MHSTLNIAVFGSGRGSNFQAILSAMERGEIPGAHISIVVSNNSSAGILNLARMNDIPTFHISRKQFASEEEFVDRLLSKLDAYDVNFIVLAGYMKKIPARVIQRFHNSIINMHPALLPEFGGEGMYASRVHEAVIASGENFSGATVHLVDEEYDHGRVVLQKRVRVEPDDTPARLAAKVLEIEHEIFPKALRMFAEGKIIEHDNKVVVT